MNLPCSLKMQLKITKLLVRSYVHSSIVHSVIWLCETTSSFGASGVPCTFCGESKPPMWLC